MIFNDPEIHYWAIEAAARGGGFLKAIAAAAVMADPSNYAILRPVLFQFVEKYPEHREREEKK